MSHYKPYPAYKASNVDWLGNVPEDWDVFRMKNVVISAQNGFWGEEPTGGDDDVLCARVADFDRNNFTVSGDLSTVRSVPAYQRESRQVNYGNLLFEKSGGGEQTSVGAVAQYIGKIPVICSNFVAVVKPKAEISSRWLCYMNAHLYSVGVNRRSINQTTGIQNIDSEKYFSESIAVPSKKEQHYIASHLDDETTRIDGLVSKKTRFIELLREKRQARITHAITKGIDPNVKMKDSGVEWLGNVPSHWCVAPMKYVCELLKDGTHLPPPRVDNGIRLLSVRNIINGSFMERNDDSTISQEDYLELCRSFIPVEGDVLLAVVGATLGKTAIIPKGLNSFHIQRSLAIFRTRKDRMNSDWLHLIFQSSLFQSLLWEHAGYSAQPGIYLGALASFSVPQPPVGEQNAITDYISVQSTRIDCLIAQIERSIELLKERRSALITAAVTGQIDLREAA